MPQRRIPEPFPVPLAGLDDREGETRDPNFCSDVRNMRFLRERAVKGPGSATLGTGFAADTIRSFEQFEKPSGERLLLRASYRDVQYTPPVTPLAWSTLSGLSFVTPQGMRMSFCPTQDVVLFSDGTLNIQVWDGNLNPVEVAAIASPKLVAFENRVLAIRTKDVDGWHYARVQWSVSGDVEDWVGLGSGFLEALDYNNHPLVTGWRLGAQCMLAKDRDLIELVPTGNVDSPFQFASPRGGGAYVSGTGCPFAHSPAVAEYFVFFVGPDDVYMWDGASIKSMGGDRIVKTLTELLPYVEPYRVQGVVNTRDEEYWVLISEDREGGVLIYDYRHDRWYRDDWPNISALGIFFTGSVGPYYSLPDLDRSTLTLIGFDNSKRTTEYVHTNLTKRNNQEFTALLSTVDFVSHLPMRLQGKVPSLTQSNTLYRVRLEMVGSASLELAYSTDQSTTWHTFAVIPNQHGIATVDTIENFMRVRFRMKSTDGTMILRRAGEYIWAPGGMEL
jgi:hypothetical protein